MRRSHTGCFGLVRTVLFLSVAAVMAMASPAWAVVPGLTGPLQALAQLVPQLLPFLAAGAAGVMSSRRWRERLRHGVRWLTTPRGLISGGVLLVAVFAAALGLRPGDRSRLAAAAPAAPEKATSWTMFRGGLGRTGAVTPVRDVKRARVIWSFSDPEARSADLSSSPAVVGNRVYAGSAQASVFDSSGMVYCLDAVSGKPLWQFQTEKQVFSSPAVVDGRVYVGEGFHQDADCKIYCLDAATGKQLWATPTKSHTESSPAVVGGRVYIAAGDDGVYCLEAATGKPLWHRGGMHVDSSPAVVNGKVYLGTGYGKLRALALDAATGRTVWEAASDLPVWGPPAVSNGRVYFGIGNGDFVKSASAPRGAVWCLDAKTGKPLWRRDLPDAVLTAVAVQRDRVYAGCRDGNLYALELQSGSITWKAGCGGPVVASPAVGEGLLYAAGSQGRLQALDLRAGQVAWTLDLAPHTSPGVKLFSSPALAAGRLYFGTGREKLFCIGE